jgi:Uma2 family endonuclease
MLDEEEPMSLYDFLRSRYYHDGFWELCRGELVAMSPAVSNHDFTSNQLSYLFKLSIGKYNMRCRVGGPNTAVMYQDNSYLLPDLFVSCDKSRVNEKGRYILGPELVVEVLSPATKSYCLSEKRDLYKDLGTDEYWVVDMEEKSVLVENFKAGYIARFYLNDVIKSFYNSNFDFNVKDVFEDILG